MRSQHVSTLYSPNSLNSTRSEPTTDNLPLPLVICCRTPPGGHLSFIRSYAAHLAAGYRTETIDTIHFWVKQDMENTAHYQHRVSSLVNSIIVMGLVAVNFCDLD